MDRLFNSKLQTKLQKIGVVGDFAPPKAQDPAIGILHEYFVAETARSLFDKRRKIALEALKSFDDMTVQRIDKAVKAAVKDGVVGLTSLFDTSEYNCQLQLKRPTEGLDKTVLKNELVKLGVKQATIDAAFAAATTTNAPAQTYIVTPKVT